MVLLTLTVVMAISMAGCKKSGDAPADPAKTEKKDDATAAKTK